MADNEKFPGITNFTVDGKCSKCGGCCSCLLPVTKDELAQMKAAADRIGFAPPLPDLKPDDHRIDMKCPFLLRDTNRCAIYDDRPGICHTFLCSRALAEGIEDYLKTWHRPVPIITNIWSLFGQTGIAVNGRYVPWSDEYFVEAEDEDGNKILLRQGSPVHPVFKTGESCPHGMLLYFDNDGIQFLNCKSGEPKVMHASWDDLVSL